MTQAIRWTLKPLQAECGLTILYVDKVVSEIMHSLEGVLHKITCCVFIYIYLGKIQHACTKYVVHVRTFFSCNTP